MRDSKNFIFVSFDQGARGHKFARVLSCLPKVHWYSCEENGIHPWNVGQPNSYSRQRQSSRFHFDRITPSGKLPPTYDYVKKYFKNEKEYYNDIFDESFKLFGGNDIIKEKNVVYCTHSLPQTLRHYFPNSKIFNFVQHPSITTDRYMQVVAKFPGCVQHTGLVPKTNDYLKFLLKLKEMKPDLTMEDVWAYENKRKFYKDSYYNQYRRYIDGKMQSNYIYRKNAQDENIYNIYEQRSWSDIKEWLNDKL